MLEKINPIYIIRAHGKTLRDDITGKISKGDYFIFFIVPGIISLFLVYRSCSLNPGITNMLLTAMSISVPLMLNLLVLMYDISQNTINQKVTGIIVKKYNTKLKYLEETCDNISFSVLIALASVIVLGFYSLNLWDYHYYLIGLTLVVYYLLGVFILTILMILKRTQILISASFPKNNKKN